MTAGGKAPKPQKLDPLPREAAEEDGQQDRKRPRDDNLEFEESVKNIVPAAQVAKPEQSSGTPNVPRVDGQPNPQDNHDGYN